MGKWRRKKSLNRRWQRNHLIAKYSGLCSICNHGFKTIKDVTIDHYIPLSKGGRDMMENYRPAHYKCNQLKGNLTPQEFKDFQEGLIQYEE